MVAHVASTTAAAAYSKASTSTAPLRRELKGNALRQALSASALASDLNVVGHPGQTDADTRRTRLLEDSEAYVENSLQ
eukprot:6183624-Pleurochrysis_carterae.AAC.1